MQTTQEFIALGMLKAIRNLTFRPVPRWGRAGTPAKQRMGKSAMDGPTGHSPRSFYRALHRGWRPVGYEENI